MNDRPTSQRLIIMRHAKSAWNTAAPTDHARPLNKRGKRDAPRVAEELTRLEWVPDIVLSSDSKRTRQTFKRMHATLGDVRAEFFADFYGGDIDDVRPIVARLDDDVRTALVLGHNPGWENMASALVGESIVMTTANAVLLSIEAASWPDAIERDAGWHLEHFIRPKELDD